MSGPWVRILVCLIRKIGTTVKENRVSLFCSSPRDQTIFAQALIDYRPHAYNLIDKRLREGLATQD